MFFVITKHNDRILIDTREVADWVDFKANQLEAKGTECSTEDASDIRGIATKLRLAQSEQDIGVALAKFDRLDTSPREFLIEAHLIAAKSFQHLDGYFNRP